MALNKVAGDEPDIKLAPVGEDMHTPRAETAKLIPKLADAYWDLKDEFEVHGLDTSKMTKAFNALGAEVNSIFEEVPK